MFAHSSEVEEVGVVNLVGVNVESDSRKEILLGVSLFLKSHSQSIVRMHIAPLTRKFALTFNFTHLLPIVFRNPFLSHFLRLPTRMRLRL